MIILKMACTLLLLISVAASAQVGTPEQLSKVIARNDLVAVRDLIRSGAPVRVRDADGYAPLVVAVLISANYDESTAPLEMMGALLDAGADIEQQGPIGSAPLAVACSHTARTDVVALLLARGAQVNARGYNGTFPLYHAVRKERAEIAQLLIRHGADVNARNQDGVTALHYAALHAMQTTIDLLLASGADINARDGEGKTPLSWAQGKVPRSFLASSPPQPAVAEQLRQRGGTE